MSNPSAVRLPPPLARALDTGRLLIPAGSGISKLGPSFLPDWRGFNRSLLEEAKASAVRGLPGMTDEAATAIRGLNLDRLPVEVFSDLIVRSFAAEGYFPVLGVIDSEHPNANARAHTQADTLNAVLDALIRQQGVEHPGDLPGSQPPTGEGGG